MKMNKAVEDLMSLTLALAERRHYVRTWQISWDQHDPYHGGCYLETCHCISL